jgi:hypothetical protein
MEFVCFVWISEQTASFPLCNISRSRFITEVESVYCAERTESYITQIGLVFKWLSGDNFLNIHSNLAF